MPALVWTGSLASAGPPRAAVSRDITVDRNGEIGGEQGQQTGNGDGAPNVPAVPGDEKLWRPLLVGSGRDCRERSASIPVPELPRAGAAVTSQRLIEGRHGVLHASWMLDTVMKQ